MSADEPSTAPRARSSFAIGVALAAAFTIGDLLLDCRVPASEQCVWGKALWPLAVVAVLIVGMVLGVLVHTVRLLLAKH